MADEEDNTLAEAPSGPRTRALFKKNQKCIIPIAEADKVVYYAGTIMKGEKRKDEETGESDYWYLVHYIGWGKKHDEWFAESDLIRYDAKLLDGATSIDAEEAVANKKRKAEEAKEAARQQAMLVEIPAQLRLRMPAQMKKAILDDYELVTQRGKILQLPASKHGRVTVEEIVQHWKDEKLDEESVDAQSIEEISQGIISYFNNALRQFLLYQSEVPLCDKTLQDSDAAPSSVYGAEHLARLFVKLPELVPVSLMTIHGDARYVLAVENALHDIMTLMIDEEEASKFGENKVFATKEDYIGNPNWNGPPLAPLPPVPRSKPANGGGKKPKQEEQVKEQPV